MARIIYLAYPIDNVDDREAGKLQADVTEARNFLLRSHDTVIFDPGRGYMLTQHEDGAEPDPRVQACNRAVVANSDAVLAILPHYVNSVGVPMEVQLASSLGVPALVVRDKTSWALQGSGIYQYTDLHAALEASLYIGKRPDPKTPMARFVGQDDPDLGVDPTPTRAYEDDAGYDLVYYGHHEIVIGVGESADIPAGVAIEWPPGVWGMLVGRSSSFRNRGLLVNTAVIDPGFRGPLFAIVRNISDTEIVVKPGERVAQIVPLPALAPKMDMARSESLSPSERGEAGFGSSGL